MRAHHWTATSIGSPETWPQPLRTALRLLLNTGHPMYLWWGPDLLCFYNDAYRPSIGSEHHPSSLGRPAREVWSEIWETIGPQIEQVMSGGGPTWSENALIPMTRNGRREEVYWTYSYGPIDDPDAANGVGGVLVVCTETTATVRAARRRAEEIRRLARLFEQAPGFIIVTRGPEHVVAFVNQAQRRVFGTAEWLGKSLREALPTAGEAFFARLDAVFTSGDTFDAESAPLRLRPGPDTPEETRYLTFNCAPYLTDDGEIGGLLCQGFDATASHVATQRLRELNETLERRVAEAVAERAEVESHLRQAQKIEALGQLTGGVAHDFNNLLMVISGGLSILDRQSDPERRRRIVEAMRQAAERGASLTRQLLGFARRQPLNAAPVDLHQQIDGMSELLDRSLRGDVEVEARLAPDLWPILVDATELELVLLNLCVNARDAMPSGGRILIGAENAPNVCEAGLTGDFVRLSVADTGVGMAPEVLARVFEPFFTTKDIGKGSGLGLAQVHGFAHQSGGSVRVDSAPGQGAVVTLLLPRTRETPLPAARRPPDGPPAEPDAPRGSVLAVEDDPEVGALVGEMLRDLGFEVTVVASASAALGALADQRPIDLVFSDIMMPGPMTGFQLAREVQARRPGLPVLLTSGYAEAARETGAEAFPVIGKPYDLERLDRAIRDLLGR